MVKLKTEGASTPSTFSPVQASSKPGLTIQKLNTVVARPVQWLWPNRIARGTLNLIAGLPGLGKSQLLCNIAATITCAKKWPTGEVCERGGCLFVQAEDGLSDVLRPRLEAAGACLDYIAHVSTAPSERGGLEGPSGRLLRFDIDLPLMERALDEYRFITTILIDPVTAFIGRINTFADAEVRPVLTALAALAERRNITVIAVAHLNKTSGRSAAERIGGSAAFFQVPRTVHMVVADPDDEIARVFQPLKLNHAPPQSGFSFDIRGFTLNGNIETSKLHWLHEKTVDLDSALSTDASRGGSDAIETAKRWLKQRLADGPDFQAQILDAAKAEGFSEYSIRRARKELGVKAKKENTANGQWRWSLPGPPTMLQIPKPRSH